MDRYPTTEQLIIREKERAVRAAQDAAPGTDCKTPLTVFDELYARINRATDRVHGTAHRIEDIGTRILGHLECGDKANEATDKAREPNGTLERTSRALACLDQSIERLEIATDRISNL